MAESSGIRCDVQSNDAQGRGNRVDTDMVAHRRSGLDSGPVYGERPHRQVLTSMRQS
jgi:hypothetical protein